MIKWIRDVTHGGHGFYSQPYKTSNKILMKEKQSKMETMVLKPSPNQQEDNYKFISIQSTNCRDFLVCLTYENS